MSKKSKEKINIGNSITNIPQLKTAAPGMKDVSEHKTLSVTPIEEKKSRFEFWKRFTAKRVENTERYKKLNLALILIFPLFICTMAEITQAKSITYYLGFWADHPGIMIFNIIIAAIIFFSCLLFSLRDGLLS